MKKQMMLKSLWVGLLCVGFFAVGCSADRLEEVDSTQAGTISSALVGATTQVQWQAIAKFKEARPKDNASKVPFEGDWFTGTLEQFTVKGEVSQDSGGGSISVTGQGGLDNKSLAISLPVTLNNWKSNELTLSGTLTLTFSLSMEGAVATQTTLSGMVYVTGLLNDRPNMALPATIDLKVETKNLQVNVCGSVAHHSVGQGVCDTP
ncbi:MAG: hypothetical protein EP343_33855 [Deltaproteobacteria bacterium]|nr:MAG: hypothetical protein EP343_33855 [Deltaproteobacteria bacterium]